MDLMIENTISFGRQRLLGLQTNFVKATFTWQPVSITFHFTHCMHTLQIIFENNNAYGLKI